MISARALLLLTLAALALPAPASAQFPSTRGDNAPATQADPFATIAQELQSDPVYVDPEAENALDHARQPGDFAAIGQALEEGRYAMAAAKARLEGRTVPERRPPCFFDPRHGPSTRDVEWAPDGYQARPVPVCEADAVRLEEGHEPMTREVLAGGRRVPLYDAPGFYAPYAGGCLDFSDFGGGGDFGVGDSGGWGDGGGDF